jgi:hypothetical protein
MPSPILVAAQWKNDWFVAVSDAASRCWVGEDGCQHCSAELLPCVEYAKIIGHPTGGDI